MKKTAFALLFSIAASAHAGISYRYATKITGDPLRKGDSGRVWIEGNNERHELDPDTSNPRPWDVAITVGGETRYLNLGNETWYRQKPRPKVAPEFQSVLDGKPDVEHHTEATQTIAGRAATKHVVVATCKLLRDFGGGTRVRTNVSTTMFVWIAADLPSVSMARFVGTEFEAVNRAVMAAFEGVTGMPLRVHVSTTRRMEGGIPFTRNAETEISEIEQKTVPPKMFQVPATFREQDPVYGVPG